MTVEKLLILQKLEIELDFIHQDAKVFPDKVAAAKQTEAKFRVVYETTKTKLETLEKEHRDLSETLSLENERLKKSQTKIKQLKTNFEFQALNREIENTKRANTEMEENIAKKAAEIEILKKAFGELEAKWKVAADELSKIDDEAKTKMSEFEVVISVKLEEQRVAREGIDKTLLSRYRFIRDRRYKDALVAIVNASCQGCFMNVPHQLYNEILKSKQITDCPNCHRMIYFKEA